MHEAIIAISKNTADAPDKVGFMVSKSTTAPVFNDIKDKSTFYKRDLVANTPLNVYLSVTDKTPATPETVADFTTDTGTSKLNNPEQFLEKNTEYTLYVYQLPSGEVIQTAKFTTIDYPTDAEIAKLPAGIYFHAIPEIVHTIGMKVGEKFMVSFLAKGLTTVIDFHYSDFDIAIINCNFDSCLSFEQALSIGSFVQQKQSGITGKEQFQEMLLSININKNGKPFSTWAIKYSTESLKTLFTFTEIEEAK